ncbi:hypothetical protein [Actinoalloteichus caeruleus]|uniref:Uncharacterized protein n=1 Tax=Actinoalloteichus caeruleus DSM 43889 TaxID=1120930 RepID=A0ABT1JM43_ACTCY|nr:hypothetical protein [Actinoalloteichus caeruleus]MCP2333334.1 hypothetical protein [Actinoalloteichus caeruleus DSM 43889]
MKATETGELPDRRDGASADGGVPVTPEEAVPRLHSPLRAVVGGLELLLALGAGALTAWMWQRGVVVLDYVATDGQVEHVSHRHLGNWLAGAVGCGTLGALLLLDAARQLVLASRAGKGPAPDVEAGPEPPPR